MSEKPTDKQLRFGNSLGLNPRGLSKSELAKAIDRKLMENLAKQLEQEGLFIDPNEYKSFGNMKISAQNLRRKAKQIALAEEIKRGNWLGRKVRHYYSGWTGKVIGIAKDNNSLKIKVRGGRIQSGVLPKNLEVIEKKN